MLFSYDFFFMKWVWISNVATLYVYRCIMDVHSFNSFLKISNHVFLIKGFSRFHRIEYLHWIFSRCVHHQTQAKGYTKDTTRTRWTVSAKSREYISIVLSFELMFARTNVHSKHFVFAVYRLPMQRANITHVWFICLYKQIQISRVVQGP